MTRKRDADRRQLLKQYRRLKSHRGANMIEEVNTPQPELPFIKLSLETNGQLMQETNIAANFIRNWLVDQYKAGLLAGKFDAKQGITEADESLLRRLPKPGSCVH